MQGVSPVFATAFADLLVTQSLSLQDTGPSVLHERQDCSVGYLFVVSNMGLLFEIIWLQPSQ